MSKDCCEKLEVALADTFLFYFKAHAFHWNVTGDDFPYLHTFFGSIYEDAHDAVDDLAERIRTLNELAPMNLAELIEDATIKENDRKLSCDAMVKALAVDNDKVMDSLGVANIAATKANEVGLANFLQERIDKHAKWGWQLRATSQGE